MLASINSSDEESPPLTESDPTAFSPPGSFGPFRVLHQIGTGVLGPVFRTYEPARDRLVAVKAFKLDLTPEQATAFADELQRIVDAGLDHPSIVRPIAAGVEGTSAYAASEYVAAESLDIALRHYAPAALDKVLPFITQLAGAIDFARAAGIGHGALHPRDIFVTPDEARATGFGVVQALERVGVRAPVRRPYTAPERVDGSDWNVAADVYSLAAIAYELLTGRRPAGGEAATFEIAADHADLVASALAHSLAEDPRARHQSALSFAAALEAAARGERTSAREPSVSVPVVPAEPISEMRPDGPTFLDIPQEPAHDLVIEPFENIERPSDRDLDEIQLRDQHSHDESIVEERPPVEAPYAPAADRDLGVERPAPPPAEEPLRAERIREEPPLEALAHQEPAHELAHEEPPREELAGEEHVQQPPLGPAGHEVVGTMEREPTLFDVPPAEEGAADVVPRRSQPEPPREREPELEPMTPVPEPDRFDVAPPHEERPDSPSATRREPPDRPRPVLLPVALTLLLGLFVGFLAGYLVGARDHEAQPQQQVATTKPEAAETAAPPPAPRSGTASSSAVSPPAAAPVQRTPPRSSEPARSPQQLQERVTPPPATGGRLAVRSTPSGAQVFVNGHRRGPTPLVIRNLPAGSYTVRLERQGYTTEVRRVALASNGARDLAVTLKRAAPERPPAPATFVGSMYLDSRPRGAKVFVDGKPMGETPLQIPEIRAGAHAVRFELAGHRAWSTSATVVAGQVSRVTGSLEREQ